MTDLVTRWGRFCESGAEADLNAAVWAAVERMRADLPPAGPDAVELEVQGMFAEEPLPATRGWVRVLNGRRVSRGRAVKRSKRSKRKGVKWAS